MTEKDDALRAITDQEEVHNVADTGIGGNHRPISSLGPVANYFGVPAVPPVTEGTDMADRADGEAGEVEGPSFENSDIRGDLRHFSKLRISAEDGLYAKALVDHSMCATPCGSTCTTDLPYAEQRDELMPTIAYCDGGNCLVMWHTLVDGCWFRKGHRRELISDLHWRQKHGQVPRHMNIDDVEAVDPQETFLSMKPRQQLKRCSGSCLPNYHWHTLGERCIWQYVSPIVRAAEAVERDVPNFTPVNRAVEELRTLLLPKASHRKPHGPGFMTQDLLASIIGEAIGHGSVCWSEIASAGVFDDVAVAKIVNETVGRLAPHMCCLIKSPFDNDETTLKRDGTLDDMAHEDGSTCHGQCADIDTGDMGPGDKPQWSAWRDRNGSIWTRIGEFWYLPGWQHPITEADIAEAVGEGQILEQMYTLDDADVELAINHDGENVEAKHSTMNGASALGPYDTVEYLRAYLPPWTFHRQINAGLSLLWEWTTDRGRFTIMYNPHVGFLAKRGENVHVMTFIGDCGGSSVKRTWPTFDSLAQFNELVETLSSSGARA